uniref:MPN domain-containing protein n=1 Tax=Caenorhabditis japonica TaxID=281687 RepID=A0A8R1I140_CAEJA
MKHQVETQALPYSTIILHCLKYPAKGVVGLLIGAKKGDKVTVTGCVPLCHESTPLAPPLELATSLVHAKFGASLVGVYFSNAMPSDNSLNTYATRLADRISSVTSSPSILIQVMNERLMSDCDQDRLVAYEKDGDNWKETKTIFQGSNFLRGLQAVIQKKLYRELADFENHLDNPDSDFYNTSLSNKLVQVAEFRA